MNKNNKATECVFCHGSGTREPVNGNTCPVCEGKGTIFVDYHSWAGDETCMACAGTGTVDSPVTCEACNGTGRGNSGNESL